jgi:subtilisin family serine protease
VEEVHEEHRRHRSASERPGGPQASQAVRPVRQQRSRSYQRSHWRRRNVPHRKKKLTAESEHEASLALLDDDDAIFVQGNPTGRIESALRVLAELRAAEASDDQVDVYATDAPPVPFTLRVRDCHWQPAADLAGFVERFRIEHLVAGLGNLRTIEALGADRDVISIQASRPLTEESMECVRSVPYVHAPPIHADHHELGDKALVAIIDGGIDVLHEAFLDEHGRTRILYLWDQRDPGPSVGLCSEFSRSSGRVWTAAEINEMISRKRAVPSTLMDYALGAAHGTHVASIAAGRKCEGAGQFAGGVAPDARIIAVVADLRSFDVGYEHSHLDALRFVKLKARELGLPVVVNVSNGLNAGAHDGTSSVERGFDLICENGHLPGYVIVKSAGNEREWRGHAWLSIGPNDSVDLVWVSDGKPRRLDQIQLWFRNTNEYEMTLIDPRGDASPTLSITRPRVAETFAAGEQYQLTYVRRHVDNLHSCVTVEMRNTVKGREISKGEWSLRITSGNRIDDGEIHAWIERSQDHPIQFRNARDDVTISVPGTARHVITVGAVDSTRTPASVLRFSSHGPTRDGREKPDLAAPGCGIVAACRGMTTGVAALDGTSAAAPHVAGAIALVLSRRQKQIMNGIEREQLNAMEMLDTLRRCVRGGNSKWTSARGCGILDVEAVFRDYC